MSVPDRLEQPAQIAPASCERASIPVRRSCADRWSAIAVVALALLLWAPRFSGPIDLRWDASVYYLLGTSLATGQGYRILSEPGSPEALQYPPLLPALVAVYQRALGSADPEIVGPWLRGTYAALFMAYGLTILALARRYLRPALALAATTLCLLHHRSIFFSDWLSAELPFALVSVGFALVAGGGASTRRQREAAAFLLAAAGFLLRTAGVVLLAAWVIEALARARWRLALTRGLLAVLPIVLWQAYVAHVRASDEYLRPAYEYQRAPYQHYNVTYLENILMVDSFRPELGLADWRALAARFARNLGTIPLERLQHLLGSQVLPAGLIWVPLLGLAALVVTGTVLLIRRGDWTLTSILLLTIALICLTPWPEQFGRYLMPAAPFLIIAALFALDRLDIALHARGSRRQIVSGRLVLAGLLMFLVAFQTVRAVRLFLIRDREGASFVAGHGATGPRFFYHGAEWWDWEEAAAWIDAHAAPDAIVATIVPHQFYLQTGLRAVYPPMEANSDTAHRLLESVPVSYVIIDELRHRDFVQRYALPAVESHPASWHLVYTINGTRIFAHARTRESATSRTNLLSK